MKLTRRQSLKSLFAFSFIPFSATRGPENLKAVNNADVVLKPKISLNLYSFNEDLRSGKISLDEVITFCRDQGYMAIDPTAYYFTGYPEVPVDSYLYEFKLKVFQHGLEISGSGIRNDFTDPDPGKRMMDERLIENWAIAAKKWEYLFSGSLPEEK